MPIKKAACGQKRGTYSCLNLCCHRLCSDLAGENPISHFILFPHFHLSDRSVSARQKCSFLSPYNGLSCKHVAISSIEKVTSSRFAPGGMFQLLECFVTSSFSKGGNI